MHRDWDLLRLLMIGIEGSDVDLSPYSDEQVAYHQRLLSDSPLVVGFGTILLNLTARGHDFLSWARNQEKWDSVMNRMRERGIPESLLMIEMVASSDFAIGTANGPVGWKPGFVMSIEIDEDES